MAVEFERTGKGLNRLRHIMAGYAAAGAFDEVHFVTGQPEVARLLARVLREQPPLPAARGRSATRLRIAPWPGLSGPARPRACRPRRLTAPARIPARRDDRGV